MKKRLIKATLFVAAVALTSTASLVAYDRYQQAVFDAANPLFNENLEAVADPCGSNEPHYGPALRVTHSEESLCDSVMWTKARQSLSSSEYASFCKCKFVCAGASSSNVPDNYKTYMRFGEIKKYWTGKRLEWVLDGYFYDCQDIGYTSLGEDNKPAEGIYLTKEEFTSAAF